ncbi:MAG: c-type cytochrome [Burkholderiaceae bacterium]|jgi:cytochrome c5|nr:c-type cytochrome [Burkholderiaceae bacterium]
MSEHESPIKTPKQLIIVVALSFIVPIVAIVLLTMYIGAAPMIGAGSDALSPEATAQRIKPVGRVVTAPEAGAVVATAPAGAVVIRTGSQVYAAACAGCHTAGVLGSPKFGDKAAWAPRLAKGYEALLTSSLKGKGAMGAQGGGAYSDAEIGKAVAHLANSAGGNFAQ